MRIGTKSVLYGAHTFWLHPWLVAWGWWKLYGFPWDPRLWVAFFVHDLGYWGSPNMDGEEGERHPEWVAKLMTRLFDRGPTDSHTRIIIHRHDHLDEFGGQRMHDIFTLGRWGTFALYHSRFYAKSQNARPSRLCIADKLSICITPWWIYRWTAGLTGEIREYRQDAANPSKGWDNAPGTNRDWYVSMQAYMRAWIAEHKDGREDTWTPNQRQAGGDSGVRE